MQTRSRSGALLTELIIVVLIFTLCASVLVQLFSFSVGLGNKAAVRDEALSAAENAAELIMSADSPADALLLLGYTEEEGVYRLTGSTYTLEAQFSEEAREAGTMLVFSVKGFRGEELLFALPGKLYRGGEDA